MRSRKPTTEELQDMNEELRAEAEAFGPIASVVSSGPSDLEIVALRHGEHESQMIESDDPDLKTGESGSSEPCEECDHPRSEHLDPYHRGYTICEVCVRQSSDLGRWNGSPCN